MSETANLARACSSSRTSLQVIDRETKKMRGERPFVFANLNTGHGLESVVRFIASESLLSSAS